MFDKLLVVKDHNVIGPEKIYMVLIYLVQYAEDTNNDIREADRGFLHIQPAL